MFHTKSKSHAQKSPAATPSSATRMPSSSIQRPSQSIEGSLMSSWRQRRLRSSPVACVGPSRSTASFTEEARARDLAELSRSTPEATTAAGGPFASGFDSRRGATHRIAVYVVKTRTARRVRLQAVSDCRCLTRWTRSNCIIQ